ncbi:GntR family transcriptional regulator [Celerinatantimonas yamalensis]|uniref:GntR family transcriptional regulator n=1 Tax=Celerinatantimonas yamalensis TaxID=559956 RepID=A0ABW9GA95_9GAMM
MSRYQHIAKQLRESLRASYTPGQLLPAETALARQFSVNRHTLRRAIDELVQDGLVRRQQGVGCRVLATPIDYALHERAAFSYNLNESGLAFSTQVQSLERVTLPEAIAERVNVERDTPAIQLQTKRFIEQTPACLIRHYLFGFDINVLIHFTGGSLHQFLAEQFSLSLRRGLTSLRARLPSLDECQQLQIDRTTALMEVHTQNFERAGDTLREYSIARSRGDLFEFSVMPKE